MALAREMYRIYKDKIIGSLIVSGMINANYLQGIHTTGRFPD